MERLTSQLVGTLCKQPAELKISLFAPISVGWPDATQNRIRWENLVRKIEQALAVRGMDESQIADFLRPVSKLIHEKEFQATHSPGIGIFHSPSLTVSVALPIEVKEAALVADNFYLLPLIQALAESKISYILALSKDNTRLLEAANGQLLDVSPAGFPKDFASTLNLDPRSPSLQSHGGVSQGKGGRNTVIQGQGGAADWSKEELKPYFRKVEHAVKVRLAHSKLPLVLACVDYYAPIYREINTYPHLIADHISGSPDSYSDADLLTKACQIVEPLTESVSDAALRRCYELSDTPRFSTDLEKIILAARSGQVETLFLAEKASIWGRYDCLVDRVKIFDEKLPEGEDLLNLAAIETLSRGGQVLLVSAHDLPQQREVAAVFRYEPIDIDYVAKLDQAE